MREHEGPAIHPPRDRPSLGAPGAELAAPVGPSASLSGFERHVVARLVGALFFRNRRAGPWPVPKELEHEAFVLPGNTGARLAARWFPHDRPRGAVVLAHPDRRYGQHWFIREGWVPFLHNAGFEVLTFDFPAYGASRGGATYYHEDVASAVAHAHRSAGGFPVHLVGVSLGAFAAANAAPRLDVVHGLVLESPYPSFGAWYQGKAALPVIHALDAFVPRSAATFHAARNISGARARRILVAATDADKVTPLPLSREVALAAPSERTRFLEVPGAAHLGLFAASGDYRQAVLETLGVPLVEAARLASSIQVPVTR